MMQYIYSVRDKHAGFVRLFVAMNDDLARRICSLFLFDDRVMSAYPDDFDLYCVGHIDVNSGTVVPKLPEFVVSGSELFAYFKQDRSKE